MRVANSMCILGVPSLTIATIFFVETLKVKKECSKTSNGGNIPAPDGVSNMTLHVIVKGKNYEISFSGPKDAWFSVASNTASPTMNGSIARCAFSDRNLHSRMPLDPKHVRLKQTCV
jgi:hypothetical protein